MQDEKAPNSPRPRHPRQGSRLLSRTKLFLFGVPGLLGLAIAVLYGWRVTDYFVSDDFCLIADNRGPLTLETLVTYLTQLHMFGSWYRPFHEITLRLNWEWFGLDPVGYHLTNLGIYWLTSVLAFLCIARLVGSPLGGLVGALLFTAYGYHAEAVVWASGRSDLLFGLFALASLWAYTGLRRPQGHPALPYGIALLSFVAALLSKESSVIVPFLLLAYEIVYRPAKPFGWPVVGRLGPFLIVLAIYLWFRVPGGAKPSDPVIGDYPLDTPLFFIVRNYAYQLVTPFAMVPGDYLYARATQTWAAAPLFPVLTLGLSALALATAALTLRWSVLRAKPLAFGLLWLGIAPLPTVFVVAERFTYVPSFGFALMTAALFLFLRQRVASYQGWQRLLPFLFVGSLLLAHGATALWRGYWYGVAASVVKQSVQRVHQAYPDGPPDRPLAFVNVPNNIHLAITMVCVMPAALRLTYGDNSVQAVNYYDDQWDLDTQEKRRVLARLLSEEGYIVFIYEEGDLFPFP